MKEPIDRKWFEDLLDELAADVASGKLSDEMPAWLDDEEEKDKDAKPDEPVQRPRQ